jgi:hypothetical protein
MDCQICETALRKGMLRCAFCGHATQQSPQMQWVDVKERMPEPGVDVLVHNSDGCRVAYWHNLYSSLGTWHNRSDSCGCCDDFDRDGVTHWMALPELGKL